MLILEHVLLLEREGGRERERLRCPAPKRINRCGHNLLSLPFCRLFRQLRVRFRLFCLALHTHWRQPQLPKGKCAETCQHPSHAKGDQRTTVGSRVSQSNVIQHSSSLHPNASETQACHVSGRAWNTLSRTTCSGAPRDTGRRKQRNKRYPATRPAGIGPKGLARSGQSY